MKREILTVHSVPVVAAFGVATIATVFVNLRSTSDVIQQQVDDQATTNILACRASFHSSHTHLVGRVHHSPHVFQDQGRFPGSFSPGPTVFIGTLAAGTWQQMNYDHLLVHHVTLASEAPHETANPQPGGTPCLA
jgi:hypothetical protein